MDRPSPPFRYRGGYTEYPVPPALARHLACIWCTVVDANRSAPHIARILPDACVDLVMVGDHSVVVAGPATLPVVQAFAPGTVIVGARLRPGMASSWLRTSAANLLNQDVDLFNLWGYEALSVLDRLASQGTVSGRLWTLQSIMAERALGVDAGDAAVDHGISLLADGVVGSVGELSRALNLSERQLHRRFRDRLGYGPKTLHRVLRLQKLLLMADGSQDQVNLALAAGYADQSHLAHEVRELTGLSASRLFASGLATLKLSDLYKTLT